VLYARDDAVQPAFDLPAAGRQHSRRVPDGFDVKRDFRRCEVLSRMTLETVRDLSHGVDRCSIDEFFFDAAPAPGGDSHSNAVLSRDRIIELIYIIILIIFYSMYPPFFLPSQNLFRFIELAGVGGHRRRSGAFPAADHRREPVAR
jgi:hypothetical protein